MKNETELLVDKLKRDLSDIKKAEEKQNLSTFENVDLVSYFDGGYLISYKELELIVNYIKNLRVASGRKP